jgi:hypothetical protein
MIALLAVMALLTAAAAAMFWPLRAGRRGRRRGPDDAALRIARDAKLGEIQDLELDFRLGKLSSEDYAAVNATLRAEAIELIRRSGRPAGDDAA